MLCDVTPNIFFVSRFILKNVTKIAEKLVFYADFQNFKIQTFKIFKTNLDINQFLVRYESSKSPSFVLIKLHF